jgi:predicted nuclease of restriction endonuclease-like (RecB) superfamily
VLRPDELNNRHNFIDLVFYHRIVKCFVLIDLKRGFLIAIKFERDENVPTLYEFIVVFRR